MIDHFKKTRLAQLSARTFGWLHREMAPALLRRRIIGAAVVFSALSAVYWTFIASDRYVSEAHVIIQRTDFAGGPNLDFSSLLGGANGGRADQLLLRSHLLSVDMLKKLDAALHLRAHYADPQRDPLSRMWDKDAPIEQFHKHYLERVSVELDEYAAVLMVKAEGFDPQTAHAIATELVQEGERFMNQMAHTLAQTQVAYLETQVTDMNARAMQARQAVLDFQNQNGLVSPPATAENISGIVAKLEAQRTELETQRSALQSYLVPSHPSIVQIDQQIAAVGKQLAQEQARLTSPRGKTLNLAVEAFQRLEMQAAFTQDVYKTALVALEKGRIEATRTIKKVSVL